MESSITPLETTTSQITAGFDDNNIVVGKDRQVGGNFSTEENSTRRHLYFPPFHLGKDRPNSVSTKDSILSSSTNDDDDNVDATTSLFNRNLSDSHPTDEMSKDLTTNYSSLFFVNTNNNTTDTNFWIDTNTTTTTTQSSSANDSLLLFPLLAPDNSSSILSDTDAWQGKWYGFNNTLLSTFYDNDSVLLTSHHQVDPTDSLLSGTTTIDSSAGTIAKVFILALVSIFGSIGNFLVVGSIIKNRKLHRPPFYFLLSMGVTDLARSGFCLPVVMATALQGSIWRHGPTACKMFAFAASFFVFSSTMSLLIVAVERHLSIVYARAYRRRCQGFINLVATLVIWTTAFFISFPPVFLPGAGDYVFISEEAQCTFSHKHYSHNDGLSSVLCFIAITSLTYFLYYRIFSFMRSHRRMRPLQHRPAFSSTWTFVGPGANGQAFINWLNGFGRQAPAASGGRQAVAPSSGQRLVQRLNFGRVVNLSTTKNEHLTRLFLIMALVHGLSWLPYTILSLWRVFLDASRIPSAFVTYAAWLSYCQVALCPLAYFVSRGPTRNGPGGSNRIIHADSSCERKEFLLENKIGK